MIILVDRCEKKRLLGLFTGRTWWTVGFWEGIPCPAFLRGFLGLAMAVPDWPISEADIRLRGSGNAPELPSY